MHSFKTLRKNVLAVPIYLSKDKKKVAAWVGKGFLIQRLTGVSLTFSGWSCQRICRETLDIEPRSSRISFVVRVSLERELAKHLHRTSRPPPT